MEKNLEDYPSIVTLEKSKKIIYQIENCICKIYTNDGSNGTGFFCYICDFKNNKKVPVMITNNHIIGEEDLNNNKKIKISFNDSIFKDIELDSKRKKYTNKDLDITIIEIKKDIDGINANSFLEIDERIYQDGSEILFKKKSAYIIQYPKIIGASVSYGLINDINQNNNEIQHFCITDKGSSGSPIILIESNKIIGVHKGFSRYCYDYNLGIFLKIPINLFFGNKNYEYANNVNSSYINKMPNNYNDSNNEIKLNVKIEKVDINKEVYFLDNTSNYLSKDNINSKEAHQNLSELNQNNTYLFINQERKQFKKYFKPAKEGNYEIILKFKNYLTDCSYMFYYCRNIRKIDFSKFQTREVNNMTSMFCCCTGLTDLDLSFFKTQKVKDMSNMFAYCSNLKNIKLSSFNVQNVTNMENMFSFCNQLSFIDMSTYVPSPNLKCNGIFNRCLNLEIKLNKNYINKFIPDPNEYPNLKIILV